MTLDTPYYEPGTMIVCPWEQQRSACDSFWFGYLVGLAIGTIIYVGMKR
jgi:hypothetical protein